MESTEKFHYDLINTTAEVGKWGFFQHYTFFVIFAIGF